MLFKNEKEPYSDGQYKILTSEKDILRFVIQVAAEHQHTLGIHVEGPGVAISSDSVCQVRLNNSIGIKLHFGIAVATHESNRSCGRECML